MEAINVGMLGLGNVGTGVYQLIQKNQEFYEKETDCQIVISKIAVEHPNKMRQIRLPEAILTEEAMEIINDPRIRVIIELIGEGKGYEYDLATLKTGKHLITADKLLIATRGDELFHTAAENNVNLMFNAAVGGGTQPISWIERLRSGLIRQLLAITNATTNFILWLMVEEGLSYPKALSRAIAEGYAEANPNSDVKGEDSAYKLAILTRFAFCQQVTFEHISLVEGITALEPADFQYAKRWGYTIKLIAWASEIDGKLDLRVHPMLVPKKHPLANISGINNGFSVIGHAIGEQTLGPGPGAGSPSTPNTVIADLLQVCQDIRRGQVSFYPLNYRKPVEVYPVTQVVNRFYLRLLLANEAGALAEITSILKNFGISISALDQPETTEPIAELAVITWPTEELNIYKAISRFQENPVVKNAYPPIRILQEEK